MNNLGGFAAGLAQGFASTWKPDLVEKVRANTKAEKLKEKELKQAELDAQVKLAKETRDFQYKVEQDVAKWNKDLGEAETISEYNQASKNIAMTMKSLGQSQGYDPLVKAPIIDVNGKETQAVIPTSITKTDNWRNRYVLGEDGQILEKTMVDGKFVNDGMITTGVKDMSSRFASTTNELGKGGDYASIDGKSGYYSRAQLAEATAEGKKVVELTTPSDGSSRKPTSYEEIDRWYNEAKTLKNKKNRTKDENERLRFLDNQLLKNVAGKKEVADNISSTELTSNQEAAVSFYDLKKDKPTDETSLKEARRLSNKIRFDMTTDQRALVKDDVKQMKANHLFVESTTKVLNDWKEGKIPEVNKGVIDGARQKLGRMFGENVEGKELDRMMSNVDFNTRAGRLLGVYMKATSGLAVSDAERTFLTDLFTGSFSDDEKVVEQAMVSFIKSMKDENKFIGEQNAQYDPYSSLTFNKFTKLSSDKEENTSDRTGMPKRTINGITKYWDGNEWIL